MPATQKLNVFLCHASRDKPLVRELYQKLHTKGWIDIRLDKILPGQQRQVVIENAVEKADVVVVFLSNRSVQEEGFVQREMRYALVMALEKPEDTIFLIPVRLEECQVPCSLREFQWADYFGDEKDGSYKNLLEALRLRLKQKKIQKAESRAEIATPCN
jgi:hypothetical protein